jgi:hypothetical protein
MLPTAGHGIIEFEEKNGERLETRFAEGYLQRVADWILFKVTKMQVQGRSFSTNRVVNKRLTFTRGCSRVPSPRLQLKCCAGQERRQARTPGSMR